MSDPITTEKLSVDLITITAENAPVFSNLLLKYFFCENFSGGSGVKNLPTKQEMRVQSLNQEDPLEKKVTTHFYILAWKSHGQNLAGYNPCHKNDRHNLANKQQQHF